MADLVIKAGKAAIVSGVVVFEGAEESKSLFKTNDLYINAWVEGTKGVPQETFRNPSSRTEASESAIYERGPYHFSFASPTRREDPISSNLYASSATVSFNHVA